MSKRDDREEENTAYAMMYWFAHLCFGVFPKDKAELAAKTAIQYMATHYDDVKSRKLLNFYGLYKSEYWQSIPFTPAPDSNRKEIR